MLFRSPSRLGHLRSIVQDFDELGLIDTLGYNDFQNSAELAASLVDYIRDAAFSFERRPINRHQPIYVLKSPLDTDGQIKMMSVLKNSAIRFRTFDPKGISSIGLDIRTRCLRFLAL